MNPYQQQGQDGVPMLGRERMKSRLIRQLVKETPQHMSLIGPTQIGKSTVLRAVTSEIRGMENCPYAAVVYWNLSHETPKQDEEFFLQLHNHIRTDLLAQDKSKEDWFDEDSPRDGLEDLFDDLKSEGKQLLLILDSFDAPLSKGCPSRDVLDWMRSLSDKGNAAFVAGSRATLQELCKSEEAQSSPFWNIFDDPPQELGPWEPDEWDHVLAPFAEKGVTVHGSARTALQEWTNGVPSLVTLVLGTLFDTSDEGEIHEKDVAELCQRIVESETQILKQLWDDCPPDLQSDLVALSGGNLAANSVCAESSKGLRKRGFARKKDGQFLSCCQFMTDFASQAGATVAHMNRLFSESDEYCSRIKEVLEIRVSQLDGVDPMLLNFVKRTLRDLDSDPEIPIYDMRGIAERAISLVVDAEFPDGNIDPSWVTVWQHGGATHPREALEGRVPSDNGRRADLFLLMTGDKKAKVIRKVSNHISKGTALLISHLWTIGRAGVHRDEGHEYGPLFAGSVCFSAVELCEHLARELPSP